MEISSSYYVALAAGAVLWVAFLSYLHSCYSRVLVVSVDENGEGPPRRRRFAPEPPGALPIIGHLHLLTMGSKPAVAPALAAMADKYGAVLTVWLGKQRVLVVSDPKVVKECFTTHDRALSSRPRTSTGKFFLFDYAGFGVSPYGSYWRTIRKLAVTHLLSHDGLRATEHVRQSEVDSLVSHLCSLIHKGGDDDDDHGTVVAMNAVFESLTLNVTTRIVAGKKSHVFDDNGSQEDINEEAETKRIGRLIKEFMKLAGLPVISDVIPLLSWTRGFAGSVKAMRRVAADFEPILSNWISQHEAVSAADNRHQEDVIHVLLSSIKGDYYDEVLGHIPREKAINGTIMSLILAAADTTSMTLTWALANMLNNTRVYEQVMEELDREVGRERWVGEGDIPNLVYLQAVVKETLRLYPPGPLGVPREANEDCCIAGYHVPKGTWVFLNVLRLHRDPKTWNSPLEFLPERFLVSAQKDQLQQLKPEYLIGNKNFEYAPFGKGRRACPGVPMANQVMHLTLATLLQGFLLTVPADDDGLVDMTEHYTLALQKATPLQVQILPRLLPHLYPSKD